ncbi:ion channel [Aerosakkonemataceae cyanobacterium BLCC-F154]|uniref:Ion channel n=1 Tax=Floridaenema fluviatile BLCC-F154 TaxID=3153640 RepID=A0ABV4YC68_9CYAN
MTKIHHPHKLPPVVSRDRRTKILSKGSSHSHWRDPYHWLLTISWDKFVIVIIIAYTIVNTLFALAYLAGGDCIANARPGSFADAFFFSIQTMASIGYGAMYPKTDYANLVVAIEALVGLMFLAMATGLMFSRFSRPTAKVLFSKVAVIAPYNGKPTLMFRTANERHNQIFEAEMHVSLVRDEVSIEGTVMRRFYDLKLVRHQTPIFALTWTGMHIIDETSPLYGETAETLHHSNIEIIVILTGIDETVAQPIHSRHSYLADEIHWNHLFVDILTTLPNGKRLIDYTNFHDVIPL